MLNDFQPIFEKDNFEDPYVFEKMTEILKSKRGYSSRMPSKNSPVILDISGGLDSIVLWYILMEKYQLQVYPLHFESNFIFSGQKKSITYFTNFFKKKCSNYFHHPKFVKLPNQYILSNPLTTESKKSMFLNRPSLIAKNLYVFTKTGQKGIIFHNSTRLAYFVISSHEYALWLKEAGIKVNTFFLGIMPDDGLTTRESTLTIIRSLNTYLCTLLADWQWQIATPMDKDLKLFLTKKNLVEIAKKHLIPIEKTWSCNNINLFWQCGICKGCLGRKLAFKQAGVEDYTPYMIRPEMKLFIKKILSIFNQSKQINDDKQLNAKQKIFNNSVITVPKYIKFDSEKGVGYLFNTRTGELTKINETGYLIFDILKRERNLTLSHLSKALKKYFPTVDKEKLILDISLFVKKMAFYEFISVDRKKIEF